MNYSHIVKEYLHKKKPNKKNRFIFLLLKIATYYNSKETVEELLKYGVDFKRENYTVIRDLLLNSNFELFKLYHKYGLDIKKNEYMFKAILKDNVEWFQYLLDNGFEINETNKDTIYTLIGFNGSLNILDEERNNIINSSELMLTSSQYNPLAKRWLENFYKKVDFYKKLEENMPKKEVKKTSKVNKI